jgi:hypothetical protein
MIMRTVNCEWNRGRSIGQVAISREIEFSREELFCFARLGKVNQNPFEGMAVTRAT